jgi:hypothetical protein
MLLKPITGRRQRLIKRARLFKQVAGAGYDEQVRRTRHTMFGGPVEF